MYFLKSQTFFKVRQGSKNTAVATGWCQMTCLIDLSLILENELIHCRLNTLLQLYFSELLFTILGQNNSVCGCILSQLADNRTLINDKYLLLSVFHIYEWLLCHCLPDQRYIALSLKVMSTSVTCLPLRHTRHHEINIWPGSVYLNIAQWYQPQGQSCLERLLV